MRRCSRHRHQPIPPISTVGRTSTADSSVACTFRLANMPELDWSDMPIHQAIKADWTTPEILIEGSLNCAKTTVWLDKEIDALYRYQGIKSLLFRWSQDAVDTKLRPAFEELLDIRGIGYEFDAKAKIYTFPDTPSQVHMFGLKAMSRIELMNKIRGLGVSRVSGDQVEEVDPQVGGELRGRMRPDLKATTILKQQFPFQLTFVSNSEDDDFWLSQEFPVDNRIKGRRVFQLSVFDNRHLPKESADALIRQYPEDHPRHRTMVLGRRAPRVQGVGVFDKLYRKDLHWRALPLRVSAPMIEVFVIGKHNPCYLLMQALYAGGLVVHAGILAYGMIIEDFVDRVEDKRSAWLPENATTKICIPIMGEANALNPRYTLLNVLRSRLKQKVQSREGSNSPDVRLATIENISTYLRRRNSSGEESFGINNDEDKFLIVNSEGERYTPFVHHTFEGGVTWDDHFVSVANKEFRQVREDDKYANVLNAIENVELNFCAGRLTKAQQAAKQAAQKHNQSADPVGRERTTLDWAR